MRTRINTEMQLTPAAACPNAMLLVQPFALAVNFQAGTINKKMQRFIMTDPAWQDRQPAAPAAQSRVIGDSDTTWSTAAIDRSRPSVWRSG